MFSLLPLRVLYFHCYSRFPNKPPPPPAYFFFFKKMDPPIIKFSTLGVTRKPYAGKNTC